MNWIINGQTDGIVDIIYQYGNVPLDCIRLLYSPHCHGLEIACKKLCEEFPYLSK